MMKRCLSLTALACALGLPALPAAGADLKLPGGIDYYRLKLLDKGQPLRVYVNMLGIGDGAEAKLLMPAKAGEAVGNHRQMNRRFMDTVRTTNRFEVYDDTAGGVRDRSDVVVDGMVVAATQDIEDLTATRKSVTRVRLSVQIKDTASGKVLKARTVTGVYGDLAGEGTLIRNEADLNKREVQSNLANDYEKALTEALGNAAAFLERTLRPVARVTEAEKDVVALLGGTQHGLQDGDKLVIFRARSTRVGESETFGIMRPVALVHCASVNEDASQCEVQQSGSNGDAQKGDYAVLADDSLKLRSE